MAKPAKETPILFGEEARQFEVKMLRPKPLPARQAAKIRLSEEGASELMAAQKDFEKVETAMWK